MKKILLFSLSVILLIGIVFYFLQKKSGTLINPVGYKQQEKPLAIYTFESLKRNSFSASKITLGKTIKETDTYISQMFYFRVKDKKVSGVINVPKQQGVYPVIVMFRGFVPKEQYKSGIGTQHAGEVFAQNNFITLAPDFLGYGESDNPSSNVFEERFQTYTTGLTLMSSLQNLNSGLSASYAATIQADSSKVGIWGHSNGGHIALSVLEISGAIYPTVLWAPVSRPFPYSILYYTDDFHDHGKALRKALATFENEYDSEKYSPANYYQWIKALLEIHQGDADNAVPIAWSNQLVDTLKKLSVDVTYFTYPGADHNLMPGGWNLAVTRSMDFFNQNFNK